VAPAIETLYAAYKDKVQFFLVYVREAHPVDARPGVDGRPGNPARGDPNIRQPRTMDERSRAATECLKGLKLTLPCLIDNIEGTTEKAYGAWPAVTTVVDIDGKVCFYSRGPGGAKPKEAETALKQLLANDGKFAGAAPAPSAEKPSPRSDAPLPSAEPKAAPAEKAPR